MTLVRNRGLIIAAAGFAAVLAAALLAYRPPAPRAADAAPGVFSAARAQAILKEMVGGDIPHPMGSAANAEVREVIVKRLKDLGYSAELQQGLVCNDAGACGTPTNIIARLGDAAAPGAAVLLAAHYDSVAAGPGASDDGVGVAALLEIARILAIRAAPPHPIVLLITDGEEPGLLGAMLFVREHPLAKQVQAAVNMDTRGTSGPSLMFETGSANAWLMHLYASATVKPITNSLYYVVYKLLPNDTDFTVFKGAGYQGFNFAFVGDVSRYHTPLDNWANANLSSIQHQGDNALGALLALANSADLHPPAGESVFFDVFAHGLIVWPAHFALPAALAILAVLLAQAALLCRYGALTGRQMSWGIAGALGNFLLCTVLGVGTLVLLRFSGKLPPLSNGPWVAHSLPMSIACAAMALLAAAVIGPWLARRAEFWGFWLGSSLLIAALSVAAAAMAPGASFALLLTASAAALAVLPCLGNLIRRRQPSAAAIDIAVLLPGLVCFAASMPLLLFLYAGLGAQAWPITTITLGLATSLLLPLLAIATTSARRLVMALASAATLSGVLITLILPIYSAEWPQRINVEYWYDADADHAHWWVQTASLHLPAALAALASFDPTPRARFAGSWSFGFFADAATLPLPAPELTMTSSHEKHFDLRLRSARGAPSAFVVFPQNANIQEIVVPGPSGPWRAKLRRLGSGATRLDVANLPADGMEFGVDAALTRMSVGVFDESHGLPEEPRGKSMQRARPPNATSSQEGDVTVVQRTVWLDPAAGR